MFCCRSPVRSLGLYTSQGFLQDWKLGLNCIWFKAQNRFRLNICAAFRHKPVNPLFRKAGHRTKDLLTNYKIATRNSICDYQTPDLCLLNDDISQSHEVSQEELDRNKRRIVSTLKGFKIEVSEISICVGPGVRWMTRSIESLEELLSTLC